MALKQGNQNPQNNMIASSSFASTAHATQWSNYLTQWAEILTRRSNLTPQRAKNNVNDLSVVSAVSDLWYPGCVTEVAFDIKQVGFTVSSLFSPGFFSPRPAGRSR